MIFREGFVSNSSSASFIISFKNDDRYVHRADVHPLEFKAAYDLAVARHLKYSEKPLADKDVVQYHLQCKEKLIKAYTAAERNPQDATACLHLACLLCNFDFSVVDNMISIEGYTVMFNEFDEALPRWLKNLLFTMKAYGGDFSIKMEHDT